MRRWTLLGSAALAAAALAGCASSGARPAGDGHVLLGAFVNFAYPQHVSDLPYDQRHGQVRRFEQAIGRRLGIDLHYLSWGRPLPMGVLRWDLAGGRIPLLSWRAPAALGALAAGRYDGLLEADARELSHLHGRVFLRWAWEMNGHWMPWNGDPAAYVAAWRHVHAVFAAAGARNVEWVWSPAARDDPATPENRAALYYPGNAYVDWIGFDGYNRGGSNWRSFPEIFGPSYRAWVGRGKPLMVAETGTAGSGAAKAAWLGVAAHALEHQFPAFRALVYFNVRKERDWPVTSSPTALRAFRHIADAPYFSLRGIP